MKILINGVSYPIDEGFTIQENYNETLDSASVRISHLANEISNIEPFDNVELVEDDETTHYKWFCIDSFQCIQEAIGQSNTTYSYSINLFSQTKKLEGIVLPNLSITPHKKGGKLAIIDYLERYLNLYGLKVKNDSAYQNLWELDEDYDWTRFYSDCPEMQWSQPTFREVLTDLMMLKDCIPTLNNNKIGYIDLTYTKKVNKPYNFIQKSMSSDDYVSEIKMELQNVMQTTDSKINNVVTTTEYLTLTSDDAIINSENCYLKTQFPILNIKHLWMVITPANTQRDIILFKQDLCNIKGEWITPEEPNSSLVKEKLEYDSLDEIYRKNIVSFSNIKTKGISTYYSQYKNFCLYYTRNSNIIDGFTKLTHPIGSSEKQTLSYLRLLLCANADEEGLVGGNIGIGLLAINSAPEAFFSTFFQIEYETTYNSVFSASKGDKPNNNRVIIDHQTNAWVDAYSQGFLEYQKANRLGNLQKMYNQRVENSTNLYEIGDQINDDIIYRTEYQFYKNHIECNAYATKNYVLRDYFTGIKSKIRTWVNAREEAFIRHELKKYYCDFSYSQFNEIIETINNDKNLAYYLLSSLKSSQNTEAPIKYALIKTKIASYYWPDSDSSYSLNCITRLIGNSIVLTTGFEDNWIVSKRPNVGTRGSGSDEDEYNETGIIESVDININYSTDPADLAPRTPSFQPYPNNNFTGITTNYLKYCNDNGEFNEIIILFLNEFKCFNAEFPIPAYIDVDDGNGGTIKAINPDLQNYYYSLYKLPVVADEINDEVLNPYIFGISIPIYKDNKEKPVISTQFEFSKSDSSINFTKLMLERQDMIRTEEGHDSNALKLKRYDENKNLIDEVEISGNINYSAINDYCAKIIYSGDMTVNSKNVKYVAYCNNSGDEILSFDVTKNVDHSLFLNIRRYRQ